MKYLKIILILSALLPCIFFFLFFSTTQNYHFASREDFRHSDAFSWYFEALPDDSHNIRLTTNVESNEMILIFETKQEISPLFHASESGKNNFLGYKTALKEIPDKDDIRVFCFFDHTGEHYLVHKAHRESAIKYIIISTPANAEAECGALPKPL